MAKILLVEDDNNLREIYGARLMAEGYEIISASDGEEALAVAVKEKPDLIISDVMMPRISGFDMLDILRNAPETKDTKVIMMTALSQAEDKERADKLGADLYLVKSQVTLEDVAKAVHNILGDAGPADDQNDQQEPPTPPAPETPPSTPAPSEPTPAPQTDPVAQPPAAPQNPQPAPTDSGSTSASSTDDSTQVAGAPQAQTAPSDDNPISSAPITLDNPVTDPPSTPAPEPVEDKPSPEPTPNTPAQPPAPEAPVVPAAEPPVSEAPTTKPIEVVLPESSDEIKAAEEAAKKEEELKEGKPEETKIDDSVGPKLSEALESETQTSDSQPAEAEPKAAPELVVESPSEQKTEEKPEEEPEPEEKKDEEDSNPRTAQPHETGGQRVIQPSEDFLKGGPDINNLLAKEEEKAAVPIPDPNSIVTPPKQPEAPESTATPDEAIAKKEDIDKVAI